MSALGRCTAIIRIAEGRKASALRADVFTILGGCKPGDLFKGRAEAGLGGEATGVADVLLTKSRRLEKILGCIDSGFDDILMRGKAGFLFEQPTEVEGTERGLACELIERQLLLQMLCDVGDGIINDATGAHIGTVLISGEKQLCQDVHDVIIQ